MSAAAARAATSAKSVEVEEAAAIDAAYAVLEAGKAVKALRRRQEELETAARSHRDNLLEPALHRFHAAQAEWRQHAQGVAGAPLELAS